MVIHISKLNWKCFIWLLTYGWLMPGSWVTYGWLLDDSQSKWTPHWHATDSKVTYGWLRIDSRLTPGWLTGDSPVTCKWLMGDSMVYVLLTSFDTIHFFLAHHIMNIRNFWPLIFQFKFKRSQFQIWIFMMQPETIQVRIQISWPLVQGI